MPSPIETVETMYAAFRRKDIPAVLDQLADDVSWDQWSDNSAVKAGVPWLKPHHSAADVAEFFRVLAEQWDFRQFEVRRMTAGPDRVIVELTIDATVLKTGRVIRDEEIHFFAFNSAGKVAEFRHYLDTAKHIAAYQGN